MSRFLIRGTKQLIRCAKNSNIRWSSSSPEVIQKYGQHVPVSVPLLKDVIDYPEPVMHKDYVEVRRMTNEWALQFWDTQPIIDYMLASDWPYMIGYHVPHFDIDNYLIVSQLTVWNISLDRKLDTDYKDDKKTVYNNLSKVFLKFYFNFLKNKPITSAMFASETASMDGMERLSVDLLIRVGHQEWIRGLFKKFPDWFITWLKHDLLHKRQDQISFADYINIRRVTFASELIYRALMFSESQDFNEDDKLLKVSKFNRFCYLFELITFLSNDIRSFKLEQSRNDHWTNGVTVLAREQGVTLQKGVEMLLWMVDDAITEFLNLGWRLANDSELNQRFPHLRRIVEVSLPNFAFGEMKTYDINAAYRMDGGKTFVDPNPVIGDRIDPAMLYKRVEKTN